VYLSDRQRLQLSTVRDCYPKTAYLNSIAGDWKPEQEALKKDGQIISYKVVQTEAHGSTDFNLMLMTEYKDLLTRKIWKKPMLYCKRSSATTKSSDKATANVLKFGEFWLNGSGARSSWNRIANFQYVVGPADSLFLTVL